LESDALEQVALTLKPGLPGSRGGQAPQIAVLVQDLIVHDNRKWFGEAEIRLDALVVHGNGHTASVDSFYQSRTVRFPRVVSGDRLPTGEGGLLIFYGQARGFLDISLLVSRDRRGADELATLLSRQLQSSQTQAAVGALAGLTLGQPHVAAVTTALGAVATLGSLAYQTLSRATGATVGVYHTTWLQSRDRFGVGRHPPTDTYQAQDLSFWYEIVLE
jgi:hypothetical protein